MPHYKDGTKAEVGDIVKVAEHYSCSHEVIGKVASISEGETCNASVAAVTEHSQLYAQVVPDGYSPFIRVDVETLTCNCSDLELVHRREPPKSVGE